MTSGVMLPLLTADLLATTIVGSVLENMDMERLIAGESILLTVRLNNMLRFEQRSARKWPSGSARREKVCSPWRKSLSELSQVAEPLVD
jgi:hypothetical protein